MEKYIEQSAFPEELGGSAQLGNSHRYKTEKGEISLLHPCRVTFGSYEIYCIDGDLFEDIERYDTLKEAEARIYQLLE